MTKEELITKQQLEIEELKFTSDGMQTALRKIHLSCVCIGGPLNDNIGGYTHNQRVDFHYITRLAEEYI